MRTANRGATATGGREATTRHIPPTLALSVGMPSNLAPRGWRWVALGDVARLESGHTPSRRHPEYWGGTIPWISIQDAKANDGGTIVDTQEHTNELGIANSSARVLPTNTVCLSRTASVGYVVVTGRPMATSQDFVNWVCSDELNPQFLKYLFVAEDDGLLRFASGAVHQTIYFPEVKAFHVCLPPMSEQKRIVAILDQALAVTAKVQENAGRAASDVRELVDSALRSAFETRSETWRTEPLETLVDRDCSLSYGIVQPGEPVENGLPIVRPTDLTSKEVSVDGLKRIDPSLAQSYRRTKLRGNDLLLCVRGSTGMVSVACKELKDANVTRGIVPINFDPESISQAFGYYLLRSPQVQEQIGAKTYGAALMQINISDVRNLSMSFPSLSEQGRIVEKLDALHLQLGRLAVVFRKKQQAVRALSRSFLHQAFCGQLV
jgi:type I restriction enzyme S subunit